MKIAFVEQRSNSGLSRYGHASANLHCHSVTLHQLFVKDCLIGHDPILATLINLFHNLRIFAALINPSSARLEPM